MGAGNVVRLNSTRAKREHTGIVGRAGLDSGGGTLAAGAVDTFKGDSDLGLEGDGVLGVEGFSVGGAELAWLVPFIFTL